MLMVPVRGPASQFSLSIYVTTSLPLKLVADVMPIHAALLVAVQPHPPGAVTFTLPSPPPELKDALSGLTEYEQF